MDLIEEAKALLKRSKLDNAVGGVRGHSRT